MKIHQWVVRAKCRCGYLWTTPGSTSVTCKCGMCRISSGAPSADAGPVTDEAEWVAAVAADLGTPVADLILEQV
jgi:hypothetical protein